jgi:hypothetical protein
VLGYTSLMVVLLVTGGGTLFSLGIVAEYLGFAVKSAMGKPIYLVIDDRANGPLERPARLAATQGADATDREGASPVQRSSR